MAAARVIRDRLGHRGLVAGRQLAHRHVGPLDEAGHADADQALVGAAEDRDEAVLLADVVLALVVPPEAVSPAEQEHYEEPERRRHDRPPAPVMSLVIVVLAVVAAPVPVPPRTLPPEPQLRPGQRGRRRG